MKLAAERTGGHFTQINPDEPIAWRSFELFATLNTPRLMDVQIRDAAGKAQFLAFDQAIAQGEEIVAVTRVVADAASVGADGKPTQAASATTLPTAIVVKGTLDGKAFERTLPVKFAPHQGRTICRAPGRSWRSTACSPPTRPSTRTRSSRSARRCT